MYDKQPKTLIIYYLSLKRVVILIFLDYARTNNKDT